VAAWPSPQTVLVALLPSYARHQQSNQHEEPDNYEPFTHSAPLRGRTGLLAILLIIGQRLS